AVCVGTEYVGCYESRLMLAIACHAFAPVVRDDNNVTELAQHVLHRGPAIVVIVDDQDACHASALPRLRQPPRGNAPPRHDTSLCSRRRTFRLAGSRGAVNTALGTAALYREIE